MLYSVIDIKNTWFKRAPGEGKIYSESLLYYRIKKILQDAGYDVIKKLMWKDGHLVSDTEYYIRDRQHKYCLYDGDHQIRPLIEPFNEFEAIKLSYSEEGAV